MCQDVGCRLAVIFIYTAFFGQNIFRAVLGRHRFVGIKTPPKWQKNDLVSGGHCRAAKLGACVNWVEWLRTSADKRMWSGRRAIVMV